MFEFNNKKKIIIVVSIVSVILIGIISYIIISSFNFRGEESSEDFELEELKENDLNSVEIQENVANSTSIEEQEGANLNEENSIKIRESTNLNGNKKIIVHISGEVISPGVISLEEGARIIDAINMADGVTEEADLSKVNLAYVLEDAQKIYIPNINEKEEKEIVKNMEDGVVISGSGMNDGNDSNSGNNSKNENVKININTANVKELQKLSGIGESIALRIVTYRKENGKFNSIEDLKNVSGIGENKFNKIKNNIFVK